MTRVRDDVLCVVYKHPTIVLSRQATSHLLSCTTAAKRIMLCRRTDQYSKACCILSSSRPVLEINEQSSTTSSPNVRPFADLNVGGRDFVRCRDHRLPQLIIRMLLEARSVLPFLSMLRNGSLLLTTNATSIEVSQLTSLAACSTSSE